MKYENFSMNFIWHPVDISFVGDFDIQYYDENTGDKIKIGYDGQRFYTNENGNIETYKEMSLIDNDYIIILGRSNDNVMFECRLR